MVKRFWVAISMGTLLGSVALAGLASAQMPTPGAPTIGPTMHPPSDEQAAPPPALPGASGTDQISAGSVAIDNENPTKVLFSAINHGNYAEARAAVSRGADLRAKNTLDETPIQLSVDLGRNNITFMLLSVLHENRAVSINADTTQAASGSAASDRPITRGQSPTTMNKRRSAADRPIMSAPLTHRFGQPMRLSPISPAPSNPPGIAAPSKGFLGFASGS